MSRSPHLQALAVCAGLALANAVRIAPLVALGAALLGGGALLAAGVGSRRALVAAGLALLGWGWASARLEALDASVLAPRIGTAARARLVVTGPARAGRYDVRVPGRVLAWAELPRVREPVLLELPAGRSPPQGAILELVGEAVAPRGPDHGFDERTWLRRRGVHVVVRASSWHVVGRRGGLAGLADRFRRRLAGSIAIGLDGERAALLQGVVLGDDGGLSDGLRDRFRASGLYHLLAVSGQNVALVAGGVLGLAWIAGVPRLVGQLAALAAIVAYVLAVGAQPSVVRAGVAAVLGSLAWLTARERDRWYFLLLGAIVLLGSNPYTLLDPGFELSFAAVWAIFVLAPRIGRTLEGYPLPGRLRGVVAISTACGLATAPIAWVHFHAIALLTVPANALAAPAVVPLLGFGLATAAVAPLSGAAAAALAWANGWCAAYLAGCARVVGGLPGAQIRSTRALLVLAAGALLAAAYAYGDGQRARARLPDRRRRPPEDPARAPPPA